MTGISITNSQYDQLPVGLIAQLVEHCIGIAQVMYGVAWVRILFKPEFFPGFLFATAIGVGTFIKADRAEEIRS